MDSWNSVYEITKKNESYSEAEKNNFYFDMFSVFIHSTDVRRVEKKATNTDSVYWDTCCTHAHWGAVIMRGGAVWAYRFILFTYLNEGNDLLPAVC